MHPPQYDAEQPAEYGGVGSVAASATGHQSGPEPYYSNHDIAILHAIVNAAQEHLDNAKGPKPLPAAALFKAYDEVLPEHGIDPDSDHHFSTFVFRIGGERGDGSLIDKFQTILGRMGIVLEFGDDSTASIHTSHPPSSPQPAPTNSVHDVQGQEQSPKEAVYKENRIPGPELPPDGYWHGAQAAQRSPVHPIGVNAARQLLRARDSAETDVMRSDIRPADGPHQLNRQLLSGAVQLPIRTAIREPVASPPARPNPSVSSDGPPRSGGAQRLSAGRAALINAMDRWRRAAVPSHEEPYVYPGAETAIQRPVPIVDEREATKQDFTSISRRAPLASAPRESQVSEQRKEQSIHDHVGDNRASTPPASQAGAGVPLRQEREEAIMTLDVDEFSMTRAARAREIFIASKFLNFWADKTARRLEREAVARRHMVRFRCFRGWSQLPTSRAPALDHLRMATAFRKLRRAVAEQEKQLRTASAAIANHLRLKTTARVIDQWRCNYAVHTARRRGASVARSRCLKKWASGVSDTAVLHKAAVDSRNSSAEAGTIRRWHRQSNLEATRHAAASEIGQAHLLVGHLRDWWDVAEAKRRAVAFGQYRLMTKAAFAFDQWNLMARAQAFVWRTEYLTVSRFFDKWLGASQKALQTATLAKTVSARRLRDQFWRHCNAWRPDDRVLTRLQSRARLYIGATRLLATFDHCVNESKEREREAVRRYLMARYTEVSSARKRRSFFKAFDHWRSLVQSDSQQIEAASEMRRSLEAERYEQALWHWRESSQLHEQQVLSTEIHRIQRCLEVWTDSADVHANVDDQAMKLWTSTRQLSCIRGWSMVSLQQSGQAHTATTLHQRRNRQEGRQALQHWRASLQGNTVSVVDELRRSAPQPRVGEEFGSTSRRLPARRSLMARYRDHQAAMDTPTRWTGVAMPMSESRAMVSMSPLDEVDEDAEPGYVDAEVLGGVASPSRPATKLASTTPRAPVPTHMKRSFHARNSSLRRSQGTAGVPMSMAQPDTPASEPARVSTEATQNSIVSRFPFSAVGAQQTPVARNRFAASERNTAQRTTASQAGGRSIDVRSATKRGTRFRPAASAGSMGDVGSSMSPRPQSSMRPTPQNERLQPWPRSSLSTERVPLQRTNSPWN